MQEELDRLREANRELQEVLLQTQAQVQNVLGELRKTQEQLQVAQARIAELEHQKTPAPAFVKANVPKSATEEKKPRKKRDTKHNQARRRAVPTRDSWSIGSSRAQTAISAWVALASLAAEKSSISLFLLPCK